MNQILFFCLIGAAVAVSHSGVHIGEGVVSGQEYPVGDVPVVRTVVPETYKTADVDYPTYDPYFPKKTYPHYYYPYSPTGFRKTYTPGSPFYHNFGSFNYYPGYPGAQQEHKYPFDFYSFSRHTPSHYPSHYPTNYPTHYPSNYPSHYPSQYPSHYPGSYPYTPFF